MPNTDELRTEDDGRSFIWRTSPKLDASGLFGFAIGEAKMGRKFIDCREFPSDIKCSLAMSADSESELLEAAVQHGVAVHGHQDTPEFRTLLKSAFHDGTAPLESPAIVQG